MSAEVKGTETTPSVSNPVARETAEAKCLSCGGTSAQRPLLSCLYKGQPRWVCVRCLPMLIHGEQ